MAENGPSKKVYDEQEQPLAVGLAQMPCTVGSNSKNAPEGVTQAGVGSGPRAAGGVEGEGPPKGNRHISGLSKG